MQTYSVAKIGQCKGHPRVWMQGNRPARAGFAPGTRYSVKADHDRCMLVLSLDDSGTRVVSRKLKNEKEIPVIDLNSTEVLGMFEGFEKLRLVMQEGRIYILPLASELAVKERKERLHAKLDAGEPILVGSLSHGGGVLSHAIHSGLAEAGVSSKLAFANDIREDLLEQAGSHNEVWDMNTIALAAPMQELAFDNYAMSQLPKVEILEAGLPCSGASVAGKAKRGLGHAEEHPEVGHLVCAALSIIAKVNPAVFVLENVKQYLSTASMWILRHQLRDMGYELHERVLHAAEWGALEHRERLCLVAVTRGMDFQIDNLEHRVDQDIRIGDILDKEVPETAWSKMEGLKAKEVRDKAAGKGFAMQIVTAFDKKCPTITKQYAKVRSTDPKLQHPSDPDLLRQFSPSEHARIKGCPAHLISGLSATIAHELLGQSICYEPFKSVGKLIGESIRNVDTQLQQSVFELTG